MEVVQASSLLPARARLGEGSFWDQRRGCLYWVDIVQGKVNVFDPKRRSNREFSLGADVGTVVPTEDDQLLVALRHGFASLDPGSGRVHEILRVLDDEAGQRFNDGKCDPAGRLWAGTMVEQGPRDAGHLYCLSPSLELEAKVGGVGCSNGLVWSRDLERMYYIDTPTQQVVCYDFDVESGAIRNRRVAVEIHPSLGAPDGMTIDADDHLWVALWGGGGVVRIDPESGRFDLKVEVPTQNATSCALGGENLDQLFITTASVGLSDDERAMQPHAGSLFVREVPYRGLPASRFAGRLASL